MKDIKTQKGWTTDEFWPQLGMVSVAGSEVAEAFPLGASQQEAEKIIQTWTRIAVLRTSADVPVYWGYIANGTHAQFLNQPVETNEGLFGVRVGDGDVTFFVLPVDLKSRPTLELVEVTDVDNPKYTELPLY